MPVRQFFFTLLLCLLASTSPAQQNDNGTDANMVLLSEFGGYTFTDSATLGDYVYLLTSPTSPGTEGNNARVLSEVKVLDKRREGTDNFIGSITFEFQVHRIYSANGRLAVLHHESTMSLYDVDGTSISAPVFSFSVAPPEDYINFYERELNFRPNVRTGEITQHGDYFAFVSAGSTTHNGLSLVKETEGDFALVDYAELNRFDPLIGNWRVSSRVTMSESEITAAMRFSSELGDYLTFDVQVFDYSDGALNPKLDEQFEFDEQSTLLGSIEFVNDSAFVLSDCSDTGHVFDRSDQGYRRVSSFSKTPGCVVTARIGDTLFHVFEDGTIERYDISDVFSIAIQDTATYSVGEYGAHFTLYSLEESDGGLIALHNNETIFLDYDDNGRLLSQSINPVSGFAEHLVKRANRVFVPYGDRVDHYDISSLALPVLIGQFDNPIPDKTWVAAGNTILGLSDTEVTSLDFSGPVPIVGATLAFPASGSIVQVSDTHLYFAYDDTLLRYIISEHNEFSEEPTQSNINQVPQGGKFSVSDTYGAIQTGPSDDSTIIQFIEDIEGTMTPVGEFDLSKEEALKQTWGRRIVDIFSYQDHFYVFDNKRNLIVLRVDGEGEISVLNILTVRFRRVFQVDHYLVGVESFREDANNGITTRLHLYDLSEPATPTFVSVTALSGGTDSFSYSYISGTYNFLSSKGVTRPHPIVFADDIVFTANRGRYSAWQINQKPSVNRTHFRLPEGSPLSIDFSCTDPDGDIVSLSVLTAPSEGITQVIESTLVYTPYASFVGVDELAIRIADEHGNTEDVDISITVVDEDVTPGDAKHASFCPPSIPSGVYGDMNGDRQADIFWQNQVTGNNSIWQMHGTAISKPDPLPMLDPLFWQVRARGDFNGDGVTDVFWRNQSSGENRMWLFNENGQVSDSVDLVKVASQGWEPVAQGDVNGDGKDDLVWRNALKGTNAVWLMSAEGPVARSAITAELDKNWQITASADMNADGNDDIIWRNQMTGENRVWAMDGASHTRTISLYTNANLKLEMAAVSDFDGDGDADILWRSTSDGTNYLWLMNGDTLERVEPLRKVSVTWAIASFGDFDGNGVSDIFWRRRNTGENVIWFFDTTGFSRFESVRTVADNNWQPVR